MIIALEQNTDHDMGCTAWGWAHQFHATDDGSTLDHLLCNWGTTVSQSQPLAYLLALQNCELTLRRIAKHGLFDGSNQDGIVVRLWLGLRE